MDPGLAIVKICQNFCITDTDWKTIPQYHIQLFGLTSKENRFIVFSMFSKKEEKTKKEKMKEKINKQKWERKREKEVERGKKQFL